MNQRHLKKTEAGPLCLPDRTGAYSKQQGYVLLMAMMLLVMMATPFLYHASMETSNEMQRDQYQKIEQRLNDLKAQMILYAKYPGLVCDQSAHANIPDLDTVPDQRGLFVFKDEPSGDTASQTVKDAFGEFKPYENKINFEFLVPLTPTSPNPYWLSQCSEYPQNEGDDADICQESSELLLRLTWDEGDGENRPPPTVYLYKNELGC